jgi:hypothetical protein
MGTKKNKSGIKGIKNFASKNKVMLAAIGGAAAGVAITRILGTEKATEILNTVENKVREYNNKISAGLQNHEPMKQGL